MKIEFPVEIYGHMEKYNDVLSKARCRIFYKYENRNGTYITDEFAEKLLNTLAYAPVKGIYDSEDYTDHGAARDEGRVYGIVPENPNVAWETNIDKDGIERTYACADVLIFTALYKEAADIVGKAQSMELYSPSLKYHEAIYGGQKYIVFDEGCFLGLQVLGDEVEPCFEGAAFFSLRENIEKVVKKIQEIETAYTKKGETERMGINFKLSDSQKHNAIFDLLNSNYNEEGGWAVSYAICDIYDDYALVFCYEDGHYERVHYTKNDETDSLELGERERVYIIDVSEKEKQTVDTLRALNGGTYELVREDLINAAEMKEKNSEFSVKIEELNTEISSLQTEKADAEAQVAELNEQISSLQDENASLKKYQANAENEKKMAVINEYAALLPEDVLVDYNEKIGEFTSVAELDKELAYELKKNGLAAYSKAPQGVVPKEVPLRGVDAILGRYVKK